MYDVWAEEARRSATRIWVPTRSTPLSSEPVPTPRATFSIKNLTAPLLSPLLSPKSDLKRKGLGWQCTRRSPLPPVNFRTAWFSHWRHTGICTMFQNGLATCDGLRGKEKTLEAANAEQQHQGFVHFPHTPRKRISKVDPAAKSPELPDEMTDVDIVPPEPTEHKIGDKYLPSKLSDHRGPYFAHDKAELVQWDYTDKDGKLIAPEELYATLKTDSGVSLPDKKIDSESSTAATLSHGIRPSPRFPRPVSTR
ncbi:hypothetical protein B0H14DRAFT_2564444 [Mycena olivaceomarginata]|nr:hypothetical protein B0H14DRAFT_2564444 [Mycena olivaceomarginata]